jgi:hypothetical protein
MPSDQRKHSTGTDAFVVSQVARVFDRVFDGVFARVFDGALAHVFDCGLASVCVRTTSDLRLYPLPLCRCAFFVRDEVIYLRRLAESDLLASINSQKKEETPPAASTAEGVEVDRPHKPLSQSGASPMAKSTGVQRKETRDGSDPWQSWPSTVRYLLVQVAHAVPNLVLVWLAFVHH